MHTKQELSMENQWVIYICYTYIILIFQKAKSHTYQSSVLDRNNEIEEWFQASFVSWRILLYLDKVDW